MRQEYRGRRVWRIHSRDLLQDPDIDVTVQGELLSWTNANPAVGWLQIPASVPERSNVRIWSPGIADKRVEREHCCLIKFAMSKFRKSIWMAGGFSRVWSPFLLDTLTTAYWARDCFATLPGPFSRQRRRGRKRFASF